MKFNSLKPLLGYSVLVTRPTNQAEPFCLLLKQAGATVYHFPAIEIVATMVNTSSKQYAPDQQDIILFTSSNAVEFSLPWLKAFTSSGRLPCKIGAIGKKTALKLNENLIKVDMQPANDFNSESLLTLPEMNVVTNKKILILKGEGGRTLLGDTLTQRGATIRILNTYKRQRPTPNKQTLTTLRQKKIDIITLTSTESCINIFSALKNENISWLTKATLLLGSARIQKNIEGRSINNPYWVARNPTDDEMYRALLDLVKMENKSH